MGIHGFHMLHTYHQQGLSLSLASYTLVTWFIPAIGKCQALTHMQSALNVSSLVFQKDSVQVVIISLTWVECSHVKLMAHSFTSPRHLYLFKISFYPFNSSRELLPSKK